LAPRRDERRRRGALPIHVTPHLCAGREGEVESVIVREKIVLEIPRLPLLSLGEKELSSLGSLLFG